MYPDWLKKILIKAAVDGRLPHSEVQTVFTMQSQRHLVSSLVRPQSAFCGHHVSELEKEAASRSLRPCTAVPRQRGELTPKKVTRQRLSKPHLKASRDTDDRGKSILRILNSETSRSTNSSISSSELEMEVVSMVGREKTLNTSPAGEQAETKDPRHRAQSLKQHTSLEAWSTVSSHDSEEYDTDLDEKSTTAVKDASQLAVSEASGLDVYEEQCRKHGFVPISYMRRHLGKRHIRMRHHYLGGKAAQLLATAFKHNTVTECLDLSDNCLETSGAAALAYMMRENTFIVRLSVNDGISDLDLSWNSIRRKGAAALANGLKVNTTLEVLDLSWNGFGLEGAIALQKALQVNTSLRVLDISNNRLDAQCALKLAIGLRKNRGLETLILNLNPLGDEGIEAILKSVTAHPSMRLLSLEEMGINQTNLHRIKELEQDKGMIILHGGSGGYQRTSILMSVLRLFGRFLREHIVDLDAAFKQQDKDHSGVLTAEEIKQSLRTAGFRLTSVSRFIKLDVTLGM
ncbi:hypothetical protein C0Q70_15423 [Pomacea canaliculata]|uniref:EF-hand domain-containing protein n=1 Tax=Pomacea canaliculata TaxID=400727 RepID=A0A2T7NUS4_POMCA|nr:hypothetical protein C0Q70_15423 [Pomacea canaliculata]